MTLEDAVEVLGRLGLVTFSLTPLGIGLGIAKVGVPNNIVDFQSIRLLNDRWSVLAYTG